jgi:hypothetical protein
VAALALGAGLLALAAGAASRPATRADVAAPRRPLTVDD